MGRGRRMGMVLVAAGASAAVPVVAEAAPDVVATIKPVHGLVAAVMEGAGTPILLVPGGASEHTYSLRPSDAAALADADLVFWIGEPLELFLAGSQTILAPEARWVALIEADDVTLLPVREGGVWPEHEDEAEAEAEADHDAGDPHVWLDPVNAAAMVDDIVEALTEADPANRATYEENGSALVAEIEALRAEMEAMLEPVRSVPYVVFHDGYQYLENRFGLAGAGAVTVSVDIPPGAARLAELRLAIAERGAACVFSEPQYQSAVVETLVEGLPVRTGVLDTLGADSPEGPELYFTLMRGNAAALADCLGGPPG